MQPIPVAPLSINTAGADADWPVADLEWLGHCPLCGAAEREVKLTGLQDRIFKVAPGRWTLWRCANCAAAYLDPRPDVDSIGRAYGRYYTHGAASAKHFLVPGDRPDRFFKRAVRASFYRWRFGHRLTPVLPFGWVLTAASARRRVRAEQAIRHLPAAQPGARLLDVGSGDGGFLRVARVLGYSAGGIEIDEQAAALSRAAGFEVRLGAVGTVPLPQAAIDQITLNHVIEHLHDPVAALRALRQALRPGGRIWLQTPNIDSLGAARFEAAWRGLEPPRHLVLFNRASLQASLEAAGFCEVELLAPQADASFYAAQSQAVLEGRDPYAPAGREARRAAKRLGESWNREARRDWSRAESITMVAYRPR